MSLRADITDLGCCVPLPLDAFDRLSKMDWAYWSEGPEGHTNPAEVLEAAGALRDTVEFNGHFGSNVFFRCEPGDRNKITRALEALLEI